MNARRQYKTLRVVPTHVRAVIGTVGLALVAVMGCATTAKPPIGVVQKTVGGKTEIWGRVLRIVGADTVMVSNAEVWTDPFSDVAVSDSSGNWKIITGIVDSRYRVMAKFSGLNGKSVAVDLAQGTRTMIDVILGVEETAWPPTLGIDGTTGVLPKGGKPIIRKGEQ